MGSEQQPSKAVYADPMAQWGTGGILVKPNESVLSQRSCQNQLAAAKIGEDVSLSWDGKHLNRAVIQFYVEQWGAQSPTVRIGAIARIVGPTQVTHSGQYALAFRGNHPVVLASQHRVRIRASPKVLSNMGDLGVILLFKGDAGWLVALCRRNGTGELTPTDIRYSYGD